MAKIDLSKYGISGTTEIVHNPSYELLFEEETKPELEGFEKGQEVLSAHVHFKQAQLAWEDYRLKTGLSIGNEDVPVRKKQKGKRTKVDSGRPGSRASDGLFPQCFTLCQASFAKVLRQADRQNFQAPFQPANPKKI